MDKALLSDEVGYVYLARQMALEGAYMVRMVDGDGWSVTAKMMASESVDLMSELFCAKREIAEMAA